ncbi:MAG: PilZ domain-containing protein [Alphaproteobacteria bacterium]|nr:PilZ domain-containing protein [Alphaproteobacteria bacterium]MBU0859249.1 PilZ domain-containing protein [Alphaproteobacteria bacterium]
MLHNLLASLRAQTSNDKTESRRRHPRRECDQCVAVIHGQTFPVQDWSPGGVQITGDERLFSIGRDLDMVLKFKLRNHIVDVPVKGQIVRKGSARVAVCFEPLTQAIRRNFQQVVDDYVAREFANSQA